MDIRDSQRIKEIRDNTKAVAEAFSSIANTLADALELFISTLTETQNSKLKELIEADRKTESNSEKPNNCEPKICDFCRYYNSNIPCGTTPSACKEADKFAKEFVDGLKKLKPKDEPQTDCDHKCIQTEIGCERTDCPWK